MKRFSRFSLVFVMLFLAASLVPLLPASAAPDPNAPKDLTATFNAGNGTIFLDWTCSSATDQNFTILRKKSSESTFTEIGTVSWSTEYADNASVLVPSTSYDYQVKNSTGSTNTATVLRGALVPAAPTNLQGQALSSHSIQATWTNNSAWPCKSHLNYKVNGTSNWQEMIINEGINTAVIDGLTESTAYDINLIVFSMYEASSESNTITVTTLQNIPVPVAPTALTAQATNSDEILLNWTDASDNETGFKIFRQEGSTGTMTLLTTVGANATTHPDAPLTPETTYYYQVCATNTAGDSVLSNIASATTPKKAEPPQTASTILKFYLNQIQYLVNGQTALLDAPPAISGERIMLPVRFVVEPMGGTAAWDPIEKKATINCNGHVLMLWLNQNTASLDGASKFIDDTDPTVMPMATNERILLPLRFVGESLGCGAVWNQGMLEATITYPDPSL